MQPNTKWTPEQDQKLMTAVRKHGRQWILVGKEMNHSRSQNAIIKRWHGYLRKKYDQQIPSKPSPSQHQKAQQKAVEVERKEKSSQEQQMEQDMKDETEERDKKEKQNTESIKKIQQQPYEFKLNWTQQNDLKLKNFIVNDGILFWDKLAAMFNTTVQQVMTRWIKYISPKLKNNVKIGGALKWSVNQDYILYAADRNKVSHMDLMYFLTCRTVYSIEARWRRICKNLEIMNHLSIVNNRNNLRREALKKIALKKCMQKRDTMSKIWEKEKQILDSQKLLELEKHETLRRMDKMRKILL